MKALLDTSLVVRYLTGDPPRLTGASVRLIEGREDLLLSSVVIAETAHVLMSYYNVPREEVVDLLYSLIRRSNIDTLNLPKGLVISALLLCRPSGRVSFPDALIWAEASAAGHAVYTFDRRFPATGVTVLTPS